MAIFKILSAEIRWQSEAQMEENIIKKKTFVVIIITLITMIAEIYFGIVTNSMALTADGFHMGCHALALGITFFVCILAIKYQNISKKLNALGGWTSALLLGLTSIGIIWESVVRFFNPLSISFSEALLVAFIGLVVNIVCIFIMEEKGHHHHFKKEYEHKENLNFKAAYFHILADALTSFFAIGALLLGKYFNLVFLDSFIGVLGGIIIAKWSIGLLKTSGKILIAND